MGYPLRAASRCTLPTGSFASFFSNTQPLHAALAHAKQMMPAAGCPMALGSLPDAGRAPCPGVLLWQASLGGTVRQSLLPFRGRNTLSLPPQPQIFNCWEFSCAAFQGCCCKQQQQRCSPTASFSLQHMPK